MCCRGCVTILLPVLCIVEAVLPVAVCCRGSVATLLSVAGVVEVMLPLEAMFATLLPVSVL